MQMDAVRHQRPDRGGTITVTDLRNPSPRDLPGRVGFLPQDPLLLTHRRSKPAIHRDYKKVALQNGIYFAYTLKGHKKYYGNKSYAMSHIELIAKHRTNRLQPLLQAALTVTSTA